MALALGVAWTARFNWSTLLKPSDTSLSVAVICSSHIERQEQIVADIDSQRRDGTAARELLRALRQMQDQYVAHRDRILHWLEQWAASVGDAG